jgi:hypothetical protein
MAEARDKAPATSCEPYGLCGCATAVSAVRDVTETTVKSARNKSRENLRKDLPKNLQKNLGKRFGLDPRQGTVAGYVRYFGC